MFGGGLGDDESDAVEKVLYKIEEPKILAGVENIYEFGPDQVKFFVLSVPLFVERVSLDSVNGGSFFNLTFRDRLINQSLELPAPGFHGELPKLLSLGHNPIRRGG